MKKILVSIVILLAVVSIAMPASAFEVKYGGLFRLRYQANDNLTGALANDGQNYIDQRLRIFFQFIASENLRLVTGLEFDTLWGGNLNKLNTYHRDAINAELKHAYLDFMIPCTPVRAKAGLQPLAFMQGWVIDEDFTAADLSADFKPVKVTAGYVAEINNNVKQFSGRVDDWYLGADYAQGPFTAGLLGFFQLGHNNNGNAYGASDWYTDMADAPVGKNNNLFDLGVNLGYKLDWMTAFLNYVQNLGSFDEYTTGRSHNYNGFMVEGGSNFFYGPFTFNLGSFVTSGGGSDVKRLTAADARSIYTGFVYPQGRSHYWSEILGLGTLDQSVSGAYGAMDRTVGTNRGAWQANDGPSNIWTINFGTAWQALEATKLTFNYYFVRTLNSVYSGNKITPVRVPTKTVSNDLGNEFDLYLDQKVVDGLMLRLVGAYMIAGDAYTIYNSDANPWELGARLQWSF